MGVPLGHESFFIKETFIKEKIFASQKRLRMKKTKNL